MHESQFSIDSIFWSAIGIVLQCIAWVALGWQALYSGSCINSRSGTNFFLGNMGWDLSYGWLFQFLIRTGYLFSSFCLPKCSVRRMNDSNGVRFRYIWLQMAKEPLDSERREDEFQSYSPGPFCLAILSGVWLHWGGHGWSKRAFGGRREEETQCIF